MRHLQHTCAMVAVVQGRCSPAALWRHWSAPECCTALLQGSLPTCEGNEVANTGKKKYAKRHANTGQWCGTRCEGRWPSVLESVQNRKSLDRPSGCTPQHTVASRVPPRPQKSVAGWLAGCTTSSSGAER